MNLDHLSPASKPIAKLSPKDRVSFLSRETKLPIAQVDQLETYFQRRLSGAFGLPAKPITLIMAPAGMGTSSMVQRIISAFPAQADNDGDSLTFRAVKLHVPADGSIKELGCEVRRTVALPLLKGWGHSQSTAGWLELLKSVGTDTMFLDDFQALRGLGKGQQSLVLNMVRLAVSRFNLNVVLIGSQSSAQFIQNDEQLHDRTDFIEVAPFQTQDESLSVFLRAFERWCPLQRPSDLNDDKSLRKALVYRTNGTTRNLLQMLRRLAVFAIENGDERITYDLWRDFFAGAGR